MKTILSVLILAGAVALGIGCEKKYSLTSSPTQNTPTPTRTPCGYPGVLCTSTDTPTDTLTLTPTDTPTASLTPTPTFTPTSTADTLSPPEGLLGWPLTPGDNMQIAWMSSTNPNVTDYDVYRGPTSGAMTYWGSLPKLGTWMAATDTGSTSFNYYVSVVASGTLPDSLPSRVVHAVSGTTATNSLSVAANSSLTPTLSITGGSVPGAARRVWLVATNAGDIEWVWGEEASALTNVAYGFNGYGYTYAPALPLSSGTMYNVIVATLNSEYWCVDYSYGFFITP